MQLRLAAVHVVASEFFEVAGFGAFVAGTGLLAVADARTQLIPRRWLYPCAWTTGLSLTCAAAAAGTWLRLVGALVSCAAAAALFLLLHRFSGMGIGDVRLSGLLALFLGWFSPLLALAGLVFGVLVGGVAGVLLLVSRRADRRTMVPFGTFLVAGCWFALLMIAFRRM